MHVDWTKRSERKQESEGFVINLFDKYLLRIIHFPLLCLPQVIREIQDIDGATIITKLTD